VPRLCEFYPGICLTTEENTRENLSQGKQNFSESAECVFVALITQRAMPMRRIVICGLSGSNIFSTSSHTREYFRKKLIYHEFFFFTISVGNIRYFKKN